MSIDLDVMLDALMPVAEGIDSLDYLAAQDALPGAMSNFYWDQGYVIVGSSNIGFHATVPNVLSVSVSVNSQGLIGGAGSFTSNGTMAEYNIGKPIVINGVRVIAVPLK